MTQATHFNVQARTPFVEQLFEEAGADAEVAQVVTRVLLEGELLGPLADLDRLAGQLQLPALSQ
ncbi:hypothetical protein Q7K56_22390 [Pseudomonas putida]|nr:hypothetical protein [Pseudomonas putida]